MRTKLEIRDGHAEINGDPTTHALPSGTLEIIDRHGKTLFRIALTKEGNGIEVSAISPIRANRKIYSEAIAVKPRASNQVHIIRLPQ